MNIRFAVQRAVALIALVSLAACATVVREPATRVVYREVPTPIVETVPALPPGAHWVPGHWVWEGRDWKWIPGHMVQVAVAPMPPVIVEQVVPAPSPAHFYVRGHWRWDGHAWVWVHGRWVS